LQREGFVSRAKTTGDQFDTDSSSGKSVIFEAFSAYGLLDTEAQPQRFDPGFPR
jgi:hypothetical protein